MEKLVLGPVKILLWKKQRTPGGSAAISNQSEKVTGLKRQQCTEEQKKTP